MQKLHSSTIAELQRLHHQAARLAVKSTRHAKLAIFLAGYIKQAGGGL